MAAIAIVVIAGCAIAYILAGYPLLLALISRCSARTVARAPVRPSVSIIIPVYNGEAFLAEKLRSVLALEYPPERMEILVVSDGSTDQTDTIADSFAGYG